MEFSVSYVLKLIIKTNRYLQNACSVMTREAASAAQSILRVKDEKNRAEQQVAGECESKVKGIASKAQGLIDADRGYVKQLEELNEKLKSVDKKYAKIEGSLSFAGITDEFKKQLLIIINGGSTDFDESIVEKIFQFFKNNSYAYISKPVSPMLSISKKRKLMYEQLAACLLIIDEFVDSNQKIYMDKRDQEITAVKDKAGQKILEIDKAYNVKIAVLSQNSLDDNEFLVQESNRTLLDIFNGEFVNTYNEIKRRVDIVFSQINLDDEFYNQIYIGDVAWKLDNNVLNSSIGKKFVSNNSILFEDGVAFLPWTLQLSSCQSVFITPSAMNDKEAAISWINQLIYCFLRQLPINGIELSIIDPERRGNSVYSFLNLYSQMPDLFSKKIFTSSEDILARLTELNQYVDSVIQQKLSNRYKNLYEYNKATPENPLPVKMVCIFDFPKAVDDRAFEYLLSIIKNANRCGIFVALCFNANEMSSVSYRDLSPVIQNIKSESICLTQKNGFLILENSGMVVLPVELPQQQVIDNYFVQYEQALKKKLSRGIPFTSVVKNGDFFSLKSAEGISLPVGKGGGSAIQCIEFGKRSSQHALITGATGSGKSTLLHTLIMSALINYSPDELNLYLMDFKSGTEFKVYETVPVPHIELLALDALQEFGESILMELVEEQTRRSQLFKDSGEHTSIKSYVTATGNKLPRILVVMDEFQILFNENANRKVALHCAELANKIVTEGRAFGIHLVMATQSLRSIREKTTLSNSTIEQMRIRIGLKCGEEDARYIFGDANAQDALMKMKGAIGTAVYNPEYTEAGNSGFRVAYCSESEQKQLLSTIAELCKGKYTTTLKVFEGKRVPDYPMTLLDTYKNSIGADIAIDIGEPIKIESSVQAVFNKKKNNNLLVVGSDAGLMAQIISSIVVGASTYSNTVLHYFDGNAFFDEAIDPHIKACLDLNPDSNIVATRKDCLLCVENLYSEFKSRRKSSSASSERNIVVINGLQYIDILAMMLKGDFINRDDYIEEDRYIAPEKDDGGLDFNFGDSSDTIDYSSAIKELIELGYAYGMYFVITCNEYQTVKDVLHYGSGILSKLTNRIVFAISDKDSDDLIDGVHVSNMNNITAVFTDGIKRTLQFKPYSYPKIVG